MKTKPTLFRAWLASVGLLVLPAVVQAQFTFTNNTAVGALDTSYDGADIIISNCTVTMDGAHSFASLQIASGGALTHSYFTNGTSTTTFSVTNEPQVLSSTHPATLLHTNVSLPVVVTDLGQSIIYTNGVDYLAAPMPDGATQLLWTNTSSIADGATVLVSYAWTYPVNAGLTLTVAGDVNVAAGGSVNVSGIGYASNFGAGCGFTSGGSFADASGGGYGGAGGSSSSNAPGGPCYGSVSRPAVLGSGGGSSYAGNGGSGGGLVQIIAGGDLKVDGMILANGANATNSRAGGGAGGSVWLSATNVSGGGVISANGGAGEPVHGGGGGGGRILIQCGTNSFAGSLTAYGGGGWMTGGAGTIFTQVSGQNNFLLVDNGGQAGTNSTVALPPQTSVSIRSNAVVVASGSWSAAGSLTVASNSALVALPQTVLSLNVNGTLAVQSGGTITADGLGYTAGNGIGAGHYFYDSGNNPCSGASHGGNGAAGAYGAISSGFAYDSIISPIRFGSGGGNYSPSSIGGNGGGTIQITVTGPLQVDGRISANGVNGSGTGGGGGSGGSVCITNSTSITGSGTISANGGYGAGTIGGGGGGGQIAIYSTSCNFSGTLLAVGGGGANFGGAGTIYLQQSSPAMSQLILDNGGNLGTNTPLSSSSAVSLIIRKGAIGYSPYGMTIGSLTILSNAWLTSFGLSSDVALRLAINGNAVIQSGGGISADATGDPGVNDPGLNLPYSSSPYYAGCGGGHGGFGASSLTGGGLNGGYDNYSAPIYSGSGGIGYAPYSIGGSGGGVIKMTVTGTLQVDGLLSANGGNGTGAGGGGGAGGSLDLNVGGLTGGGVISVNGGNGVGSIGGGGGGGNLAVTFTSNLFSGTISAYGGAGANYGGAGVLYFKTNGANLSAIIVDNGGHRGTNTPLPIVSSSGLILRNGAMAFANPSIGAVASLLIASNSWLILIPGTISYAGSGSGPISMLNLTVTGNATIQSGGGIIGDATGSLQNSGSAHGNTSSASPWYPCGGGGHGGCGANSFANLAAGGMTYDSTTAPNILGSGGGGYSTYSTGGMGGGYINLQVCGALQVDGAISVNGGNGSGSGGGGGSGGSIYLSSSSLAGDGSIAANGGYGALNYGGGGGGGRIAIYYNSNSFAGTVSAYGGGGANFGGAGTVYYQTNNQQYGLLVLDNANNPGANTTFDNDNMNVTIQNGAVGLLPSSSPWFLHNLLIHTNALLTASASSNQQVIHANFITIDPGGLLSLDGAGFASQSGNGFSYGGVVSGGGSYGGYGGGIANGGTTYGSIQTPVYAGSGGANYNFGPPYSYGGYGGGALQLLANTITVNGRLSANGLGGGANSGGGSGGSLYFQNIFNLAGNGIISANGGPATGPAGSGGGGRIALICASNNFTGQLSACGGTGLYPGGAGTVYTSIAGLQTLSVDNGGINGTNTPFSSNFGPPAAPFNLNISGGATLVPLTPLPLLSNLTISAGSRLTVTGAPSTFTLAVLNNFYLAGSVNLDSRGYPQTNGPGAGIMLANEGSGGGSGGVGGSSATGASGGTNYGSVAQPVDFGSGGGGGVNTIAGGSDGGGAVRVTVGGVFTVDGSLSANGNDGWQDNSGGGAGGSIWVTAGTLAGAGNISAFGGDGVLFGGGGGGGGRIAIYTPTNNFTGATNVVGGTGAFPGQSGTIFLSSIFNDFQVISQTPVGLVSNTVSLVDLAFNEAVAPTSLSAAAFSLVTPAGQMSPENISVSTSGPNTVQVTFPTQNLPGNYSIQAAATVTNIFGQPLAQVYTGGFTILPTISGTVTNTNGAPVSGVQMQLDGGLTAVLTDTNGIYFLGVPSGWIGTVTPALGTMMFVPGSLAYTNVTSSLTGQNYLMVPTVAPNLGATVSAGNLALNWSGIPGVTYQAMWSTNLVVWQAVGDALPGSNGVMQISLPLGVSPAAFFRLVTTH